MAGDRIIFSTGSDRAFADRYGRRKDVLSPHDQIEHLLIGMVNQVKQFYLNCPISCSPKYHKSKIFGLPKNGWNYPKIGTMWFLLYSNASKRCRWNGNQCRPWSNCSWRWIWVYTVYPRPVCPNTYRNFSKFSDRQVWANSSDLDQIAPRGAVWSESALFAVPSASFGLCIFWMHYSKETPSCSTFRVITINFRVSEILGFLR